METTTKSTSAGTYRLSNLPVGAYTLTVSASGFTKTETRGIAVELGRVATANVTLAVGTTTERVDVTAAAITLDTTTANVAGDFTSQQVMDLPSASTGSGVINLALLERGRDQQRLGGSGHRPSVGGQRPRNNNFMVEGLDNNSGSVTGPLVTVPNDAVAEFSVQQNMYSPEFGHSSGGQFNQIVKSGTNNFHGEAYEYLENRDLNAADNLSAVDDVPLHPRYDNNRFGGSFGGPIKKNKLFFYGLYEYQPIGSAGSAGLLFAPTANGWNTIQSMSSQPGFNQTSMNQLKKYLGTAPAAAAPANTPYGAYPLLGPGNASLGNQTLNAVPVEIGQTRRRGAQLSEQRSRRGIGGLQPLREGRDPRPLHPQPPGVHRYRCQPARLLSDGSFPLLSGHLFRIPHFHSLAGQRVPARLQPLLQQYSVGSIHMAGAGPVPQHLHRPVEHPDRAGSQRAAVHLSEPVPVDRQRHLDQG